MKYLTKAMVPFVVAAAVLAACGGALAASGCATVTEVTSVNKPPMADIYRLDKRGVSTGGQIFQLLTSFTPLGALASGTVDIAVEVGGSAVRQSSVESDRKQELANQKWEGVFDVTYRPDFGEPITITIRESEIKRYGIEKGARVVMFDPNRDVLITTDAGKKVTRTRPSIHVPVSGLFSTTQYIPMPVTGEFSEDYKMFCFAGQTGTDYKTMSGPWNSNEYKQSHLTRDELFESQQVLIALKEGVRKRSDLSTVEKDQSSLDLMELELTSLNLLVFSRTVNEVGESRINLYKEKIPPVTQQIADLKHRTGLSSSPGIDSWLGFVNESAKARAQDFLDAKAQKTAQ